jgi:high-affinity nickel-transport protein
MVILMRTTEEVRGVRRPAVRASGPGWAASGLVDAGAQGNLPAQTGAGPSQGQRACLPARAGPRSRAGRVVAALTPAEWSRAGAMTAAVLALHIVGWGMLAAALRGHYHISKTQIFGVGTGVLAYTLGMRHAFDADHIAAIDNTTRKLVGEGKRPLSVGFFFSLGHSSVVLALTLLLNIGIHGLGAQLRDSNSSLQHTTGVIGVGVSSAFLFLIAALNMVILAGIIRIFRGLRAGAYSDSELDEELNKRGLMMRFLGPLARRVDAPWKMYPIGLLFGLGFDTATEVALLVMAGTAVAGGLPFYAILSLPVLFAAGMSLFDTADGCFMNFAYDWAFARPARKIFYNLTITGLSVFVAVFIGVVEVLGLIARNAGFNGAFWSLLSRLNVNTAGFVIVGIFVVTWIVSLAIWHFGRFDTKWQAAAESARDLVGSSGRSPGLSGGLGHIGLLDGGAPDVRPGGWLRRFAGVVRRPGAHRFAGWWVAVRVR